MWRKAADSSRVCEDAISSLVNSSSRASDSDTVPLFDADSLAEGDPVSPFVDDSLAEDVYPQPRTSLAEDVESLRPSPEVHSLLAGPVRGVDAGMSPFLVRKHINADDSFEGDDVDALDFDTF